jgi:hypothetical protein
VTEHIITATCVNLCGIEVHERFEARAGGNPAWLHSQSRALESSGKGRWQAAHYIHTSVLSCCGCPNRREMMFLLAKNGMFGRELSWLAVSHQPAFV